MSVSTADIVGIICECEREEREKIKSNKKFIISSYKINPHVFEQPPSLEAPVPIHFYRLLSPMDIDLFQKAKIYN